MTIGSYRKALTLLKERSSHHFNETVEITILVGRSGVIKTTCCSAVILGHHQPNEIPSTQPSNTQESSKVSAANIIITPSLSDPEERLLVPGMINMSGADRAPRDSVKVAKLKNQVKPPINLTDRKAKFVLIAGKTTTIIIGKTNSEIMTLTANIDNLITQVTKARPRNVRLKEFVKKITLKSTMSQNIDITQLALDSQ